MTKQYRPWTPEQTFLLPPSPMEWLPEGHLAYFVLEVVRELDVGDIEAAIQKKDGRGERPYSPRMMTALLLYAYCVGIFSSRKIERATYEDVAFRVIAGDSHPYFTTVNTFRLEHRDALAGLFVHVLKLCARAGLGKIGHVSVDGTKVQANASKHKAMSYGRMKEEDKRLRAEIETMLFRADETDASEDARYGRGQRADELPEEFQRRNDRLERIRSAKAALEQEALEARAAELREQAAAERTTAEQSLNPIVRQRSATRAALREKAADELAPQKKDDDDDDDDDPNGEMTLPNHRVATTADAKPTDKAQRNFTDPDSRIMVKNGVFLQAYNAHAVVNEAQIIVAQAVTNQSPDVEHFVPMLERVRANCAALPEKVSADSGYLSEENIGYAKRNAVDAYIAVQKKDTAENLGRLPMTDKRQARLEMREKLSTSEGHAIYERRKAIVEPVFGQIRTTGFRRFSLRGLGKVRAEWGIVCLCHNLLKLLRTLRPQIAVVTA